jgi:hypothetical protein
MAIDGEGEGEGGGGVLDGLIGGEGAGGEGAGGEGAGGEGGEGEGGGSADAEWLGQFSAEGGDADNPSNRDWLKSKGFKSLDEVAKSYRAAEQAIHDKGSIKVPGDGAKPEEIAAFNKAIGVPETADGYTIALPEGVKEDEIDMDLINPLKEQALAAGVPAKGFQALVDGVIKHQMDQLQASAKAETESRDGLLKEWGGQKDAKLADVNNAMRALNLKRSDVAAIQRGFAMQYGEPGSRRTLELLQALGAGVAEDMLLGGDGPRRFGVTGAEAQKEIDTLIADKTFDPVNNPEHKTRWERLTAAVAADRDRQAKAQAGG